MPYLEDWKKAKANYENVTNRSKPPANVKGAFGKSSGIEGAAKALDTALAKPTAEGLLKAETAYHKAMAAYVEVLDKAIKDEKGLGFDSLKITFQNELKKLKLALEKIASDFTTAKRTALENAPQKFQDIVPQMIIDGLVKSPFPTKAGIKAFNSDPKIGLSGLDNKTKLPGAVAAQNQGKASVKRYLEVMKAVNAAKSKVIDRKTAWKYAYNVCTEAAAAVGPMEGFKQALANWLAAQEQAFIAAKRRAEFRNWLDNGPVSAIVKQAGDESTDEQGRLNQLETFCDKHR